MRNYVNQVVHGNESKLDQHIWNGNREKRRDELGHSTGCDAVDLVDKKMINTTD